MKFEMPDDEDTVSAKVRSSAKCYYWFSLTLQQYNSFLRTILEKFVSISNQWEGYREMNTDTQFSDTSNYIANPQVQFIFFIVGSVGTCRH
jgi:hypothetical protein